MNFVYCLTIQLIFIKLFAFLLSTWIKTSKEQMKEQDERTLHYTHKFMAKNCILPCMVKYRFIAWPIAMPVATWANNIKTYKFNRAKR